MYITCTEFEERFAGIIVTECPEGTFGVGCTGTCGHCANGDPCAQDTGYCAKGCASGWHRTLCDLGEFRLLHVIWASIDYLMFCG